MGILAPSAGLAAALLAQDAAAAPPGACLLRRSWRAYERGFIQRDGRVIDRADHDVTTSEGQAYALHRAVWIDDRRAFDRLLRWTRDNLQGGEPTALPAWRWGQRDDGTWGVIDPNPAADADVWMAHALLAAADQWGDPAYRDQAVGLIATVWEEEVAQVGPWRVLLPGPWARDEHPIPVNPSYWFFPAFRAFAAVDPGHPWMELVDHGYALLGAWMAGHRLPPDWAHLDPDSGVRLPDPAHRPESAIYGFEAMRVPLNLAADVAWFDETRGRALLVTVAHLGRRWRADGRLAARMHADGSPAVDYEHPALYGALLPAWGVGRPDDADALYQRHLDPLLRRGRWGDPDDYYAQNLVWQGIALWTGIATAPEVRP